MNNYIEIKDTVTLELENGQVVTMWESDFKSLLASTIQETLKNNNLI